MSSIFSSASIGSPISADDLINGSRSVPSERTVVAPVAETPHSTAEAVAALANAQKDEGVAETSWFGKVERGASKIGDFFKNAFSRLGQMIANAWAKVKDLFSRMASVVASAASAVGERASDLANRITSKPSAIASHEVEKAVEVPATAADDATSSEADGSVPSETRTPGPDALVHGLSQQDLDELDNLSPDEADKWFQRKTGRSIKDEISDMEFNFNPHDIMGGSTSPVSDVASPVALSLTPPPLTREATDGEISFYDLKIRVIGGEEGAVVDTATQRFPGTSPSTAQSDTALDKAA